MADVAFFDVDDTLTINGMESFLGSFAPGVVHPQGFMLRVKALMALQASGADRDRISAEYFQMFSGENWAHLMSEGEKWAAGKHAAGTLFIEPVVDQLRKHKRYGDRVIFISGSFEPLLAPVARLLGADWVSCSEPEVQGGVITGRIGRTMVGEQKGQTVRAALCELNTIPENSHGYGDHISDLPLLEAVGHPVVVHGAATSPELLSIARERGWKLIPV